MRKVLGTAVTALAISGGIALAVATPVASPVQASPSTDTTFVPMCQTVVSGQTYGTTNLPCATQTPGDDYSITILLPDGTSMVTKNYTPVLQELWEGAYVAKGYEVHDRLPEAGMTIEEDDPKWECEKMGNRVCGTHGSRPKVSGE